MAETVELLGKLASDDAQRDAIHIAVAPVLAGVPLYPGNTVLLAEDGKALLCDMSKAVGIVDPFLTERVEADQRFWLYLKPGSITSLRHQWAHPAIPDEGTVAPANSVKWLTAWAKEHIGYDDYYGGDRLTDEELLAKAIEFGYEHFVGPYEGAADHINHEWWDHWEAITGDRGDRSAYFSCSC